jgi:CubicO group peptidase (beta-lactamase class C family)
MKLRLNLLLMVFCLVFISPALAETLPSTVPEAVGFSSERLNRIDATLMADIDKGKIEGAVLLVARKGKIAYFKNFGMRNKEADLPMEKDSIFRIYSMTKPLVSVNGLALYKL